MKSRIGLAMFAVLAATTLVLAHDNEEFQNDRKPPYKGTGYRAASGRQPPAGFASSGIILGSWVTLGEFGGATTSLDDCWGYVSPSGREYALIGLSNGTGIVEVTDPMNAQIITVIDGPNSIWRDIKTYQQFAYAVSEGGGGIQVIDLSQVDNGVATLVNTVTTGGRLASHNVIINVDSGFLYRAGGGGSPVRGLRVYDLSTPSNPVFVGEWNNRYCHDAQVVNWTAAPFAGREIAICFANDGSGGGNAGIDILDVSDKSNITIVGSVNLTAPPVFDHPAVFSHQGWMSPDRSLIYFGDEIDEGVFGTPTTTRIIDISDLTNPTQVATFTNGNSARDHNVYTLGDLIFEANYRSGVRVFNASDPLAPVEIAFFDTYPADDDARFNGLWNVFPYFPSGTFIGSDIEKGLFVWRLEACLGGVGDCSGNGQCVNGACVCDPGWSGADCSCSTAPCVNNCSGNGTCVCGACVCDAAWVGDDCSCDAATCGDTGNSCTRNDCSAGVCSEIATPFGDVNANGLVNLFDLFCVLDGFSGDFSNCPLVASDVQPCAGNAVINLFDLFAVLDAFTGVDPCCGG